MKTENLTIYGDSIMKGVVLEGQRYKIGTKIEVFADKLFSSVTNRSRFGSTIEKGICQLETDLARHTLAEGVVLLEFGGNDCDFDWSAIAAQPDVDREPNTTIDRFAALYRRAIALVREAGSIPVLANLPPISSEKYLRWICRGGLSRDNILHWLGDENAIYRYQERYSHLIDSVAREEQTGLVDLRGAFLKNRSITSLLCDDGIHPNQNGQRLIVSAFETYFNKPCLA